MPKSLIVKSFFSCLILAMCLLVLGCKTTKQPLKTVENITEIAPTVLIKLHQAKGRCKKCPNYNIELLDNQTIKYTGKANMEVMGVQIIQVAPLQFQELLTQFEQSNFTDFEPYYLTRIKDLPRTAIIYQGHEVSFQTKACPEKLMLLVKKMEAYKPVF